MGSGAAAGEEALTQGLAVGLVGFDFAAAASAALVLLHPEYEVLFLPCLDRWGGGHSAPAPPLGRACVWVRVDGEVGGPPRIKEWLSAHLPENRRCEPTLDQLPLTRFLDFPTLRRSDLACLGTLERALRFLSTAAAGEVYPARIGPDVGSGPAAAPGR